MPVSAYYRGSGSEVMAEMKKRYGDKGGERVFYATANKRGLTPGGKTKPKSKKFKGFTFPSKWKGE